VKRFLGAVTAAVSLGWASTAAAEMYVLQIKGFGCELCAYSVQSRLGKLEGVEEVRASFKDSQAIVRSQDGVVLSEEKAREVVEGAGFKLTGYKELPKS
jgi:copper chaperone CopZ